MSDLQRELANLMVEGRPRQAARPDAEMEYGRAVLAAFRRYEDDLRGLTARDIEDFEARRASLAHAVGRENPARIGAARRRLLAWSRALAHAGRWPHDSAVRALIEARCEAVALLDVAGDAAADPALDPFGANLLRMAMLRLRGALSGGDLFDIRAAQEHLRSGAWRELLRFRD